MSTFLYTEAVAGIWTFNCLFILTSSKWALKQALTDLLDAGTVEQISLKIQSRSTYIIVLSAAQLTLFSPSSRDSAAQLPLPNHP